MLQTTDIAKLVSEAWKKLDPEERKEWDLKAEEDKARYEYMYLVYSELTWISLCLSRALIGVPCLLQQQEGCTEETESQSNQFRLVKDAFQILEGASPN